MGFRAACPVIRPAQSRKAGPILPLVPPKKSRATKPSPEGAAKSPGTQLQAGGAPPPD